MVEVRVFDAISSTPIIMLRFWHNKHKTDENLTLLSHHAKNKTAGRIIPFLVLGFWDKKHRDTRRRHAISPDFPATTGI